MFKTDTIPWGKILDSYRKCIEKKTNSVKPLWKNMLLSDPVWVQVEITKFKHIDCFITIHASKFRKTILKYSKKQNKTHSKTKFVCICSDAENYWLFSPRVFNFCLMNIEWTSYIDKLSNKFLKQKRYIDNDESLNSMCSNYITFRYYQQIYQF